MGTSNGNSNGHQWPEDPEVEKGSLESFIVEMARSGQLKQAAHQATEELLKKGIPISFIRNLQLIRKYPDGHEEIFGEVTPTPFSPPEGVTIIESTK